MYDVKKCSEPPSPLLMFAELMFINIYNMYKYIDTDLSNIHLYLNILFQNTLFQNTRSI